VNNLDDQMQEAVDLLAHAVSEAEGWYDDCRGRSLSDDDEKIARAKIFIAEHKGISDKPARVDIDKEIRRAGEGLVKPITDSISKLLDSGWIDFDKEDGYHIMSSLRDIKFRNGEMRFSIPTFMFGFDTGLDYESDYDIVMYREVER